MTSNTRSMIEINHEAMHLLYRELGAVNAVRFLMQYSAGFGDYTRERNDLLGEKSLEQIIREIKETRR